MDHISSGVESAQVLGTGMEQGAQLEEPCEAGRDPLCPADVPSWAGTFPHGIRHCKAPQSLDGFLLSGWGCAEQPQSSHSTVELQCSAWSECVPSLDTAIQPRKMSSSHGKKVGNRSPDQIISQVPLSPYWLIFRAYHRFNCFWSF